MRTYQRLDSRTDSDRQGVATLIKPMGPSPAPVLGWALHKGRLWYDPVGYLEAIYKEYGLMSSMGTEPPQCIFSFAPQYNRHLTEEADSFHWLRKRQPPTRVLKAGRPSLLSAARDNIFTTFGEEYKTRGILLRPAFNHIWVKRWRDCMVTLTEQALAEWQTGQVRDVHEELNRLVHVIAMKTVLGVEDQSIIDLTYNLEKKAPRENFGTALLPLNLPGTPFRKLIRTTTRILLILEGIVADRLERGCEPTDMLGVWLSSRTEQGAGLSKLELVAEAYNLMHHSTTMSALIWTLILILQHPSVHANLIDELNGVLRGEAPDLEHMERLSLLDYVVKESFRLLPPAAFGHRFTTRPCSFGPYDLPQGMRVIFSSYITHRLPSIYTDPNRFYPERWQSLRPSIYEYFPFGTRTRHCFGSLFATLEIKIVLAILLQRFRLKIVSGQRIDRKPRRLTLLRPSGAVRMKVLSLDHDFNAGDITGNIREMVNLR